MKKFFSIALALLFVGTVVAQEIPASKETVEVPPTAQILAAAGQLVKYGYAEQEALPLIQAAEIYSTLIGDKLDAVPEQEGGTEDADAKRDNRITTNPAQLLADAASFANGDATLLALIDNVKNSATRGAVGGEKSTTTRVKAGATDVFKVRFRGGERAMVLVSGDGDTDLDLFIYNANGDLVDSDTDDTDDCVCIWTPRYTSTYTIKVKNYGRVYNEYTLVTN